ncbi:putative Rhs family protein, partial [Candidatus Termititenax persephonae]
MRVWVRINVLIALCCVALPYAAEPTTANILEQVAANVNGYEYLQAEMRKYRGRSMGDVPAPDWVITGNYYFTKQGISDNYTARIELDYGAGGLSVSKIADGALYDSDADGDHHAGELQASIWTELHPGFESYLFSLLGAVTLNKTGADNYIVTADVAAPADYEQVVMRVSGNTLTEINYYVTGNMRAHSIYLEYSGGPDVYLKKIGYPRGAAGLDIVEYERPGYAPHGKTSEFSPVPDEPDDDGGDGAGDLPEWLPGHNVKFQEGAALSPFASYGVAGESVPGSSGALQLSYTDLVLPGVNGLDFVLKRSYLSQQMNASPKPNSFKENPFRLDYPIGDEFGDEYNLIMPDGWGGWMGRGWQTNIGGELYVNEMRTFSVGGPVFPPIGDAYVAARTARSFTFQTADGQRGDFYQEDSQEKTVRLLGSVSLSDDYDLLRYYRDQLETDGTLGRPGRFAEPQDRRLKMKLEEAGEGHYIVHGADGKRYHFELPTFEKEATWQQENKTLAALSTMRSHTSVEFKSAVYYLTAIEDVNGNRIRVEYERLHETITDSKTRQKTRTRDAKKWSFMEMAGIYEKMATLALLPKVPGISMLVNYEQLIADNLGEDTASLVTSSMSMVSLMNAAQAGYGALEGQRVSEVLAMQKLHTVYRDLLVKPAVDMILEAFNIVPGAAEGNAYEIPMKIGIFAASQYLMEAQISDTRNKSSVGYSVSGWRPKRVVDTLGREIEFGYSRDGHEPEHIGDSQIRQVRYRDAQGNAVQIEYHYDGQGFLDKVTYPAGNAASYEYRTYEQGRPLTAVNHPSGYRSEYEYRWFRPKADATTLMAGGITEEEDERWSYYIVTRKRHSGSGEEARETRYEYRDGTYYNLSREGNAEGRRWYFKRHDEVDALGRTTRRDYTFGMPELVTYPTVNAGTMWETHHRVLNEYDLGGTNLLTHTMTLKNTSMRERFYEYDEYGQAVRIRDMGYHAEDEEMGGKTDQRTTHIAYDNSLHGPDNPVNIYGLVKEQHTTEPEKDAGRKYGHVKREYDDRGRMTAERKYYTDTDYIEDRYEYDSHGNIVTHTDPAGTRTDYTYQYNAYPQTRSKTVDGQTYRTESEYSWHTGSLLGERDENGYAITYEYDKLNRKTRETHPDNTSIRTDYLDSLYRTEVTDRKGRKATYKYNPYGELKTMTDPLNNITTYRTDRLGRLDTITLADNREYRYTYDEVGRPTKMT